MYQISISPCHARENPLFQCGQIPFPFSFTTLIEKRSFSVMDSRSKRRRRGDDEGFRMNRAAVECTYSHLKLEWDAELFAFPRGGYHLDLERRRGRKTDFCATQPFARPPLKWTKAKAGRLTLGGGTDGGADIADRLTRVAQHSDRCPACQWNIHKGRTY